MKHAAQQMETDNPAFNPAPEQDDTGWGEIVNILIKENLLTREQVVYGRRILSKVEGRRTLLDILKDLKYINDEQIRAAIRDNRVSMRIGSLLVELGYISDADLQLAFAIQEEEKPRRKLGEVLVKHNFIDARELVDVLSLQMGIPVIEPEFMEIDKELVSMVAPNWYDTHKLMPIGRQDGHILVAFADPLDRNDKEAAERIFGSNLTPAIALESSIQAALQRYQRDRKSSTTIVDEDSVVGIVNAMILAAIKGCASDIHIEPLKDRLRVRFRQDGVLCPYKDFPSDLVPALTSRLKIMCEVDITERRRHQGGRILFDYAEGQLDLRSSFYITVHGEKIVLRLLNRQNELLNLKEIGMAPRMLAQYNDLGLALPSGVMLITGPTGSGKTTTVYSCLHQISTPQISIVTAEEPVEALVDGIAQCSINPKINLTFEETLRHIVRQDPDVIVIGEIRDNFSAKIAVNAALTGHKVLTTFHTEDSIGGLVRLLNMEIEPYLVSSTVVCILAQRLLRKVCPACQEPYQPTANDLRLLGYGSAEILTGDFKKARGCPQCRHTGYRGRLGIFELLLPDEAVRSAVLDHSTSQEIRRIGIESTGLVTLLEDGIAKAAMGFTSIEEVLRCLPRMQKPRPLAELQRLLGW